MLISNFLPQAMSFDGLLSDKRLHSCNPTAAQADVRDLLQCGCHHPPLSHSTTPSSVMAWMFSAPQQRHFEVFTWKKATCYFFFEAGGQGWRAIVSAAVCSEAWQDTIRGALEVLQKRGRAECQRTWLQV